MSKTVITIGDPGGIGPEIALKAISQLQGDYVVVTGRDVLPRQKMNQLSCEVVELETPSPAPFGIPSATNGLISFRCLEEAVRICKEQGYPIVTAPISKESWHMAGFTYPGHTEYLAEATGTDDYAMTFVYDSYRVMLLTTHLPLKDVTHRITPENVRRKIMLASEMLKTFVDDGPVDVLGFNPHAGEHHLFGDEEQNIIKGIEMAKRENVRGPYPADAYFRHWKGGGIVLAMYHDQGLIPFKIKAGDQGVNLTYGLPFIRTSPDHGTAFDIAGKGIASAESMIQAIKIAQKLSG